MVYIAYNGRRLPWVLMRKPRCVCPPWPALNTTLTSLAFTSNTCVQQTQTTLITYLFRTSCVADVNSLVESALQVHSKNKAPADCFLHLTYTLSEWKTSNPPVSYRGIAETTIYWGINITTSISHRVYSNIFHQKKYYTVSQKKTTMM